ncbi:MAG: ActS/PrrB/RegB family redox-sensitive histidine kinase [Alphaproteobacteria bacterium]|nr:ActS/PrrB/RegB family redox-sensitive histidine kinase [Alphaproteobacteria bacterium]
MSETTLIASGEPRSGFGRISLRTLVPIRWVAIAGQALTLLVVHYGLGFSLPLVPALSVVGGSVLLNIVLILLRQGSARLGERDAALCLGYDILQLAILLNLTGGLQNPFSILILAPVTVAATILSRRPVIALSVLAVAAISVLALWYEPLPWRTEPLVFPAELVLGIWVALVLATLFIAGYTWSVAQEARRLRDAVAATQLALAREQRISAVGALAAAAAHELGSPLATIAVVAKELAHDLPDGSPHSEDAALLLSQSERCRRILAELGQQPEHDGGSPYTRLPISALVEAAGALHRDQRVKLIFATAGQPGPEEPLVRRSPEIMHGLNNLIQNAVQFARREVSVTTYWDRATVTVEIADDGPGFPLHLLGRLGEPYISTRAGAADHMGLGIFIAQSLLERSGAQLVFDNLPDGGAHVAISWNRANLEMDEKIRPVAATADAYR